jgi:hypothetical protein
VSICLNLARTAAIEVRFSINFAVVFDFNVFPFPPSKPKLIGDVPMNRQNAAAQRIFFFSLLYRAVPIDATNRPAPLGDARRPEKKSLEIKFENYRRCIFGPHYLLAQGYIVASINWRSGSMPILSSSADLFHSPWRQQFAAFCLFVRTLPIDFALLGRKRKYIKIKTTAKFKAKRTSIATI